MKYLLILILFSNMAFALDIDEKLTIRILKVSTSKKTVLINRGVEDGLAIGDHAKFFETTGVIARGVVIQASPARSIWSLYRVIKVDDLVADKAMKIKISTPVKLTPDNTKALTAEPKVDTSSDKVDNIPLAEGAKDVPSKDLSADDKKEFDEMKADKEEEPKAEETNKKDLPNLSDEAKKKGTRSK